MAALHQATEADIVEMTEDADVKMKKPHRRIFVAEWKKLLATAATDGAGDGDAPAAAPVQVVLLPKYVAAEKQIRVGKAADATHGIQVLMGMTDHAMSQFYADPIGAISKEFAVSGSADDKENLRCVLDRKSVV